MKRSWNLIAVLAGLCVLIALIAFCLPNQNGMMLSYLTIVLASVVGLLCIGSMLRIFSRGK